MDTQSDREILGRSTVGVFAVLLVLEAGIVHIVLGHAFRDSYGWVKWVALAVHGSVIGWVGLRLLRLRQ